VRTTIAVAGAAMALAAPAIAQAHVTLQPDEAPAGGFARLDVRVPNERDNASTTKVEVKFPPGFAHVSTEPVPGWTAKLTMSKLAEPITDHGDKITEQVSTISWTGTGPRGRINPGQFQDFGLSVGLPDEPGKSLTFKALQTYGNGEVVRWIGAPDAEEPAPQVKLTAAADTSDDTGAPTWLAVLALVVGAGGLLAGAAALVAARRGGA
jgi:uncharacterized protein YcnI